MKLSDYLSSILQVRRNAVLGKYRNSRTINSVSEATNKMEHNGAELNFLSFYIKEQNNSVTPHHIETS